VQDGLRVLDMKLERIPSANSFRHGALLCATPTVHGIPRHHACAPILDADVPPRARPKLLIDRIGTRARRFWSLGDPLWDTSSAHVISEFERELICERTGEGRKRAMANGARSAGGVGIGVPALESFVCHIPDLMMGTREGLIQSRAPMAKADAGSWARSRCERGILCWA
jgi:hypothetical protein